jgi:preprotein translocase subunit SecD
MLDFPRWKVWTVILTILFCFAFAVPSFFPESTTSKWPGWVPQARINLGLDLAGGSHILLEADTADIARQRIETMEQTVEAEMRRRDAPRISIGDISTSGGRLSFMVRDASQVDAARERINQLNRFVLTPTSAGLATATNQAMEVATEVVRRRVDELGTREPTIIRQGSNRIVVQVPGLDDPQALKDLLGKTARLEFRMVAGNGEITTPVPPAGVQYLPYAEGGGQIAVERRVAISGDELTDANQGFDPQDNRPVVNIRFDSQGGRKFANLSTQFTGRRFAIIVDNVVISAPSFNEPIPGGSAQISGSFTVESANTLAISLRSGRLPVELAVIEERTISAELGADSIEKGVLAGIVGSLALMFFMIITYMRFGVYTTLALVVNAVMILGIMAIFDATLTLPGIAGFVLTVGAAVDANVLINERIREEQRRGRHTIQAVEFGYKEASRAIFDANITNVISAAIMFVFGSGPIRGFAVVLAIGIATSVFTGVTFTRLLVADWLKRNRPKHINI